jgi:hypothetical protein
LVDAGGGERERRERERGRFSGFFFLGCKRKKKGSFSVFFRALPSVESVERGVEIIARPCPLFSLFCLSFLSFLSLRVVPAARA